MSERHTHLDRTAVVALLVCTALWGINQVATKLALAELPPLLQAALRSAGAALLLAGWGAWRGLPLRPPRALWAGGLLAGALFAAEFGCVFVGLQFTTASRMVVFIYLAPFIVSLAMRWIAPAEHLRPVQLAGLALAFGGVVWAFAEGFSAPAAGPHQWLGDALGVAAALMWAGTTLTIRATALSTAPAEQTLMLQLVVSAVLLGGAGLAAGEVLPTHLSAQAAWAMAFQVVIVTFASYLVWFWLVRHYPATKLSAFSLFTPLFGLLAGVGWLNEPLTLRLAVALAAVVAGIALVSRPPRVPPVTAASAGPGAAD